MSFRRTPSQRSTSTVECVRRTATEGTLPEGADDPDGQWPGHCHNNTPQARPFDQASRNEVNECSTAIPAFCGPPAQGLHKATTEFSTLVSHALAVADAPEKYPIMELKRAAIVLENEQKSHALSKRLIEIAASGSASKRAKPAQLVCALPASSSSWVSCDNCKKWRRIAHEPEADNWYCSDNLDTKHSTCSVPQEMTDAAIDCELELAQEAAGNVAGTLGVKRRAPSKPQRK